MPIPTPVQGETRDDFVSRCIPAILDEYGRTQAAAICISTWNEQSKDYQHWKSFDDEATRFERIYSKPIEDALMEGLQPVLDTFNGESPKTELFNFEPTKEKLREIYEVVGSNFGLRTIREQKAQHEHLIFKAETDYRNILVDEMIKYFNSDAAAVVGSIERVSRDVIEMVGSKVFQTAVEEGWGIDQTAKALERQFKIRSASRAKTIARTETLRAASIGDLTGIRQVATETSSRIETTWIPTFDNSARDFHMSMAGQSIIDKVQTFTSGQGNSLRYPRDEKAPASETINCRCTSRHRLL